MVGVLKCLFSRKMEAAGQISGQAEEKGLAPELAFVVTGAERPPPAVHKLENSRRS